jgi:chlorite dismutase
MLSLLDPRLWLACALAIALSFGGGYFKGSHDRGKQDDLERQAEIARANSEARALEQQRQRRVDDVARIAATSENRLRADAARARHDADGLRSDLDAIQRASEESLATANKALRVTSTLFARCTQLYLGVAEDAQRADSEARELRQAWPQ